MGVVWAATHTVTRKKVALKFLKGPVSIRPELRRRFLREARAVTAVVHPNVLEVHDVFEIDDQTPVMLMDLLEGETLGQRISREGALSVSETAGVLAQVVSAVGTAHGVGVVHRDLKPDNVFLVRERSGSSSVRVLDFGIAKLMGAEGGGGESGIITGTGTMLGTPCYMSPEQSFGEKNVDHRTDVWAIGAMLYECLTGARPVEGDSLGQVVKRLMSDSITPIGVLVPNLPADIVTLVERMLNHDREQRPGDLREVLEILERHTTVRAPPFGPVSAEPPPEDDDPPVGAAYDATLPASNPDRGAVPETAASHTVSAVKEARAPRRAVWLVAAIGAIGLALLLSRSRSDGAPSPGAQASSSNVVPASAPRVPSVEEKPHPTPDGVAAVAPVAPAQEPVKDGDKGSANRTRRAAASPKPPAPVASTLHAPPPSPAAVQQGGLAQKPPF
jgi:serine/threonine-protein kinase